MSDEPFDSDLRAVVRAAAPADVPPELRQAVAGVPHRQARRTLCGWLLPNTSFAGGLAGIVVLVVAALLLVVVRPLGLGPSTGGLPTPSSDLITSFVEQTDGVFGYRMLRPSNWTPQGFGLPMGRGYVAPRFEGTQMQGLVLSAVNLRVAGEATGPHGMVAQWLLFQRHPALDGWTAAIEQLWRGDGYAFTLLRVLPTARVYALTALGGTPLPAVDLVAYAVDEGQPLGLMLEGSGTYASLATLEQTGIVDDLATMAGSLRAIPPDPQDVHPALPTLAPGQSFAPPMATTMPAPTAPTGPATSAAPLPTPNPNVGPTASSVAVAGIFGSAGLWVVTEDDGLTMSDDRGASWRVMGTTANASFERAQQATFVLDAQHAWSVIPGSGGPGTFAVERTSDGGASWQVGALPGSYANVTPSLDFLDAQHGYLLLGGGTSTVLRTSDGGATWQVTGSTGPLGSEFASSAASTLWAGGQGGAGIAGVPLLAVSRDGGASWSQVTLPGLDMQRGPTLFLAQPPRFFGGSGLLQVEQLAPAPYAGSVLFYHTADGGRTWTQTGALPWAATGQPAAILDADHIWLQAPRSVVRVSIIDVSADAGTDGEQLHPRGLPSGDIAWLGFWDTQHGAAVATSGDTPATASVYLTDDGGSTWRPAAALP